VAQRGDERARDKPLIPWWARRVLISATGAAANTLKIRPPLVFSEANVDRLLSETEAVIAAL